MLTTNTVHLGKCEDVLKDVEDESVDLIFNDPPFNIDLKYNRYNDNLTYGEYYDWSESWINESARILKPEGSMYVAIGDEFAGEISVLLKKAGLKFRNWIVWHYTFGQNQRKKFSRCHTHILYFTKHASKFTFNLDDIRVPSARQLKYKDKRAKSGGKSPDDVWSVHMPGIEVPDYELKAYPEDFLVWNDSRICGTFKERYVDSDGSAHPCQMPLSVVFRIVKASSNEGDLVLDAFAGTGTTAVSAKQLNRNYIAIEMDPLYVDITKERLERI
jgi:site-specific DNA-methyltransferase (adenine-specific)